MSVFTKIIDGDIPGRFVYCDEEAVAFATIEPIAPGHVLVVPRKEIDQFTHLSEDLFAHLSVVAQRIGKAAEKAFDGTRAMTIIAGMEVPHVHIHVVPARSEKDIQFTHAHPATADELDATMEKIRDGLITCGFEKYVPKDMYHLA